MQPTDAENEAARLADLYDCNVLDTEAEREFDDLVQIAATVCDVPIALVTLVDRDRLWFKARVGMDAVQTPRDVAFCAMREPDVLIVPDALADARFRDDPLVMDTPQIRFYVGVPLLSSAGHYLGALSVIDRVPREIGSAKVESLRALGRQAVRLLEARRRGDAWEREAIAREQLAAIVAAAPAAILAIDREGVVRRWSRGAETLFGWSEQEVLGGPLPFLPENTRAGSDALMRRLLHGDSFSLSETQRLRRDGSLVEVSISSAPMHGPSGEVIGAMGVILDITERKRSEGALEKEREFLRAVLDSVHEGVVACDASGALTTFNAACRRLYEITEPGLPAERWAGQSDLFHPDGVTRMQGADAPLSRALAGEVVHESEVVIAPPNGEPKRILVNGRAVYAPSGEKIGAVLVMHDVTERRRSEEALEQSRARLLNAQRIAKIGDWSYDTLAEKLTWSDETFRIFERDPALGPPTSAQMKTIYHPDDEHIRRAENDGAVKHGTPFESDRRIIFPDGRIKWVHTIGDTVQDAGGRTVSVYGTVADITERVRSEQKFRVLFEQSSNAHLLLGEQGIVDCNPAAVAMLRCRDKSDILFLHPAVLSPEFQPDGRRSLEKCVEMDATAHRRGFHRFEWIHRRLDGEEFPGEVTLTPVDIDGSKTLLVVWRDLTEQKRSERRLQEAALQLETQMIALGEANARLEAANAQLEVLATCDALTGLANRRAFDRRLHDEVERAGRSQSPLSLILLDIDQFKPFNDAFGHPAGDIVLQEMGALLRGIVRETDMAARYGGEEIAVVAVDTDLPGAMELAERIRHAVESAPSPRRPVTVSIGVAAHGRCASGGANSTAADLIAAADKALYQSKRAGRNRVTAI